MVQGLFLLGTTIIVVVFLVLWQTYLGPKIRQNKMIAEFIDKPLNVFALANEDITNKEWNERRRVWDRIFKDSLTFSSAGWSNELHSDLFSVCYDYKEMLK